MALKKSQIYSSLWQSCDALRGGMDASQYKDYVLTLLFMKYVSDKHTGDPNALIKVPEGGGFDDIVRLKGNKDIGEKINTIIAKLAEATQLKGVIDLADFDDSSKLGSGKDKQDRLSRLVAIFDDLDLSSNRAGGDDLLGDAYEYLMTHFATESGKSKGQFYTPAEVSRIMAQVVGVGPDTEPIHTIYDPTCGSGSLLLRAANEAPRGISIYGQEMDNATWSLAKMNMFLHDQETAVIWQGNTLADPYFKSASNSLRTFDFAVANPPFSHKDWASGVDPFHDEYRRFEYGVPPPRNGDYAFLLHLITSLNSRGKGAIVMPHGVLFRGNKEADIRRNLLTRGLIKGVIGLPANLFYGTGIPACILIIDKENARTRSGVFMIDASRGFIKDGPKNRLREQDIHKIVNTFNRRTELLHYSRMVPMLEIASAANDYNLNIPRYIDASDPEDLHDLDAHLNGGIPDRDIDALNDYWEVFPNLRHVLFERNSRPGYSDARVQSSRVKDVMLSHDEFEPYRRSMADAFECWCEAQKSYLENLDESSRPKSVVQRLSEDLLARFDAVALLDPYDVYQRFMDYWDEVMQDDVYLIGADGWMAGRVLRNAYDKETPDFTIRKGKKTLKYVGELIPSHLVIDRFLQDRQEKLKSLETKLLQAVQCKEEFEEEHSVEGGALYGLKGQKGITRANVRHRVGELRESILRTYTCDTAEHQQAKKIRKTDFGASDWTMGISDEGDLFTELDILYKYLQLLEEEGTCRNAHKEALNAVYEAAIKKYAALTESEIKELVVNDKWFADLRSAVGAEESRLTQRLTGRVGELEGRYARPLPELERDVNVLCTRVEAHIRNMGITYG